MNSSLIFHRGTILKGFRPQRVDYIKNNASVKNSKLYTQQGFERDRLDRKVDFSDFDLVPTHIGAKLGVEVVANVVPQCGESRW
jgi:hypothetical protein